VIDGGPVVTPLPIEPKDRTTVLVHYYRAMVGRADMWRMRMDTATNWAIGATAAVISFALGNAAAPHYVVHLAALLTLSFLMLEARRLTFYHLWQQRVLLLEDGLVRPAVGLEAQVDLPEALDAHLGRTAPNMPILKAVARRLRRVYVYLFGVQLLAWVLKLSSHPTPSASPSDWLERAAIGTLSGAAVAGITGALFALAIGVAVARGGRSRNRN
jgi:uncharacterized membrane protein